MKPIPYRFPWLGQSCDWYATWSSWAIHQVRSLDLTHGVRFSNWPFGVIMHMFQSVSTRGIWCRCVSLFFCTFLSSNVICKSVNSIKKQCFCLTCFGKNKMWPKVEKSGVVGFWTSQTSRWSLLRSFIAIRGKWAWAPPPSCGLGWRNSRFARGLVKDLHVLGWC